jgi:hypothetical protein
MTQGTRKLKNSHGFALLVLCTALVSSTFGGCNQPASKSLTLETKPPSGSGSAVTQSETHTDPEFIITDEGVVFFDVTLERINKLSNAHSLPLVSAWPIYQTTNFQHFFTPSVLTKRAEADPGWPGGDLGGYRVYTVATKHLVYYLFYNEKVKVLVVFSERLPETKD